MNANQELAARLHLARRGKEWWIIGGELPMGPYNTRAEAQEIKAGVQLFLRNEHKRNFVTVTR